MNPSPDTLRQAQSALEIALQNPQPHNRDLLEWKETVNAMGADGVEVARFVLDSSSASLPKFHASSLLRSLLPTVYSVSLIPPSTLFEFRCWIVNHILYSTSTASSSTSSATESKIWVRPLADAVASVDALGWACPPAGSSSSGGPSGWSQPQRVQVIHDLCSLLSVSPETPNLPHTLSIPNTQPPSAKHAVSSGLIFLTSLLQSFDDMLSATFSPNPPSSASSSTAAFSSLLPEQVWAAKASFQSQALPELIQALLGLIRKLLDINTQPNSNAQSPFQAEWAEGAADLLEKAIDVLESAFGWAFVLPPPARGSSLDSHPLPNAQLAQSADGSVGDLSFGSLYLPDELQPLLCEDTVVLLYRAREMLLAGGGGNSFDGSGEDADKITPLMECVEKLERFEPRSPDPIFSSEWKGTVAASLIAWNDSLPPELHTVSSEGTELVQAIAHSIARRFHAFLSGTDRHLLWRALTSASFRRGTGGSSSFSNLALIENFFGSALSLGSKLSTWFLPPPPPPGAESVRWVLDVAQEYENAGFEALGQLMLGFFDACSACAGGRDPSRIVDGGINGTDHNLNGSGPEAEGIEQLWGILREGAARMALMFFDRKLEGASQKGQMISNLTSTIGGPGGIEEMEDEEARMGFQDRKSRQDFLVAVSQLARLAPAQVMVQIVTKIRALSEELLRRLSSGHQQSNTSGGGNTETEIANEQLHWSVLIISGIVADEGSGETPEIPETLFELSKRSPQSEDAIITLTGILLTLFSRLASPTPGVDVSPQVIQTLLYYFRCWSLSYLLPRSGSQTTPNFKATFDGQEGFGILNALLQILTELMRRFSADGDVIHEISSTLGALAKGSDQIATGMMQSPKFPELLGAVVDSAEVLPEECLAPLWTSLLNCISRAWTTPRGKLYFNNVADATQSKMVAILNSSSFASNPQDETIVLQIQAALQIYLGVIASAQFSTAGLILDRINLLLPSILRLQETYRDRPEMILIMLTLFKSSTSLLTQGLVDPESEAVTEFLTSTTTFLDSYLGRVSETIPDLSLSRSRGVSASAASDPEDLQKVGKRATEVLTLLANLGQDPDVPPEVDQLASRIMIPRSFAIRHLFGKDSTTLWVEDVLPFIEVFLRRYLVDFVRSSGFAHEQAMMVQFISMVFATAMKHPYPEFATKALKDLAGLAYRISRLPIQTDTFDTLLDSAFVSSLQALFFQPLSSPTLSASYLYTLQCVLLARARSQNFSQSVQEYITNLRVSNESSRERLRGALDGLAGILMREGAMVKGSAGVGGAGDDDDENDFGEGSGAGGDQVPERTSDEAIRASMALLREARVGLRLAR